MKYILLLFLFVSSSIFSQDRERIKGIVSNEEELLENVYIQNISNRQFTISNEAGEFSIRASFGDTLVFSHVSMLDEIIMIDKQEFQAGLILVVMSPDENELNEIVLDKTPEISAVSVGIIAEEKEKLSTYERRLKTAGDFKWYHVFGIIGGGLDLNSVLNSINGRTKEIKRNIKVERKIELAALIKANYWEYMAETFGASPSLLERFLDYLVVQEGLEGILETENEEQIQFYLTDHWFKFTG